MSGRRRWTAVAAIIVVAAVLAGAVWFAVSWARGPRGFLAVAPPPPVRDYPQELYELGRRSVGLDRVGEDLWPAYLAIVEGVVAASRAVPDAVKPRPGGGEAVDEHFSEASRESRPPAPFAGAASDLSRSVIAEIDRRGLFAQMDAFVPGGGRAARPQVSGRILDAVFPDLALARTASRALSFAFADALRRGDDAAAIEHLRRHLGLAGTLRSQPIMIGRLVGLAVTTSALSRIREEVVGRRPSAATLRALLADTRAIDLGSAETAIEGERLLALDALPGTLPSPSMIRAWNPGDVYIALQTAFDAMAAQARLAPGHRHGEESRRFSDVYQGVASRNMLVEVLLPATSKYLQADDQIRVENAGTVAMLAIELHIAVHGSPPASLDAIDRSILAELPQDPVAHRPFGYRLLGAEDPHGRAYLLYSVGRDGVDDGGTRPRERLAALIPTGPDGKPPAGADWVLNEPAGGD